jgi:hypothetical protein
LHILNRKKRGEREKQAKERTYPVEETAVRGFGEGVSEVRGLFAGVGRHQPLAAGEFPHARLQRRA